MVLRGNRGLGYVRLDWFTPDGLGTWGDGRLFILGTDGYIGHLLSTLAEYVSHLIGMRRCRLRFSANPIRDSLHGTGRTR